MGCGVYWQQIRELERALGSLRRFGILETDAAYLKLAGVRSQLLRQVGLKFPRTVSQLLKLAGLSPGELTLWHDVESGWLVEARAAPGSPPVYHAAGDELAERILKGEVTHAEHVALLEPDDYVGE